MNEVMVRPSVEHQVGSVQFHNYEEILTQAQKLAEYVSNVVVTEESVKATKKMLAEVNKKVNELEDGRKAIKKELLAPYEEFEKKIKSITSVVKEADNTIRSQVRELEEQERSEKHDTIVNLFEKRSRLYPTVEMFRAVDFIKPTHLNKSTPINKVEQEMVEWFEQRKQDVEYIKGNFGEPLDIIVEYVKTQNLVQSIQTVEQRNKVKEAFTGVAEKVIPVDKTIIIAIDEKDLQTLEAFMKLSNINYTIKRGN